MLPFAAANQPDLALKVDRMLSEMRAAPAYGRTAFLEANLRLADGKRPVRGALGQQGLLDYLERWCSRGGCGRCPLSN